MYHSRRLVEATKSIQPERDVRTPLRLRTKFASLGKVASTIAAVTAVVTLSVWGLQIAYDDIKTAGTSFF